MKNDQILYTNIINDGSNKLNYLGEKIKKHTPALNNVSDIVMNVTAEYTTKILSLFKVMAKHEVIGELERQFYYLYIVESSNEIFLEKSILLLDTIATKHKLNTDKIEVRVDVNKVVDDVKKSNLFYVCLYFEVCRSFPAFSDQLAGFLNVVLKLPTIRFREFIKILKEMLVVKMSALQSVMNGDIQFAFEYNLKSIAERPEKMKKIFVILTKAMTNKYKLFKPKNGTLKTSTKIIRLLIDIIDKGFEGIGEDAIKIEFDNIRKSLESWSKGEKNLTSLKTMLTNSCNYALDILNVFWDPDTKDEVKLLIEVYVTGETSNIMLYDDLFYKGPKLLRNENHIPAVDNTI